MIICESVDEFLNHYLTEFKPFSKLDFKEKDMWKELYNYCKNNLNNTDYYAILSMIHTRIDDYKDYNQAFQYASVGSEKGSIFSICVLGICYGNGYGCEKNIEKEFYCYQQAAAQGNATAQCDLGFCYENGQGVAQDYNQAVYWYEKSAAQGDIVAQHNLGRCYYYGQGVAQDYNKAVYWYEKTAVQGFATAQCSLGFCYENGQGVAQDYNQAVYWYEESATQGDAIAQNNLGKCYYYGQGVAQDYNQAVYWYEKSAAQGVAAAQCTLGHCYENGQGVAQDYNKAVYWYEKSAIQGYAVAQNNLGNCYGCGQGVDQDYKKAFYWYQQAAAQGYARAQYNLGYCYRSGQGVERDYEQALYWFTKSANQKYLNAYLQLSSLYAISTTTFRDLAKSMFYENLANGIPIAVSYYNVGYRYYIDENINHNKYYRYKIALDYVSKAFESGLEYAKDFKEQLEELLQKALFAKNEVPKDYKELHVGKSKDVFISWNHNDLELKNQYFKWITDNGFTCWNSDINCHGDVREACIEGVLDSSLFVVIISGNTLESNYVKIEIQTMLNRLLLTSQHDWKNYIKLIYINRKTKKNGKIIKFDVRKEIEKMSKKDPNNPFVKLFNSDIGSSEGRNGILDFIKEQVKKLKLKEYKEKYLLDVNQFEGALQNTILSNQTNSGAFSTTFKYEDAYIEQPLYHENSRIDYQEILNSEKPILIYGEGGIGKTLYLKNLTRISFTGNSFFFFLPAKEIVIDKDDNFYKILYRNFESRMKKSIQVDCIQDLLEHDFNNFIYIVVDGLDEISNDEKIKLLNMIYKFAKQYNACHYIFSSRNSEDGNLISTILHQETLTYTLKGMTSEDVNRLYDQILLKTNNNQNKKKFLNAFNRIDASIRKNPMIISNLIIIYLMSGKIPSKIYEIIQCMVKIVFENQEKDFDASFKYKDFFNENELRKILEYIAYMRAIDVKSSSIELLKIFYNKYSYFKEKVKEDSLIAQSVNDYLKRRGILIQGYINHQMYSDYFASSYCYCHAYRQDSNDQSVFLLPIKNGIKIDQLLKNIHSYGEQWIRIILYFLLQVDYICCLLDKENKKNEAILKELFVICLDQFEMKKLLVKYLKNKQFYHSDLLQLEIENKKVNDVLKKVPCDIN